VFLARHHRDSCRETHSHPRPSPARISHINAKGAEHDHPKLKTGRAKDIRRKGEKGEEEKS
jgi:hypothetical protein